MNIKTEKKGKCGYLYPVAVIIAFIIGVFLRLYHFGVVPNGLHQDEAYAAYEAYSLLNYGKDSWGYVNPIYFTAWGSGMNVLESYLMIPWIAVFGLKVWVIRIPQFIVAILSMFAFYKLTVELTENKWIGLIALFYLAVCPWHVMMSRWGLESNLAPGFLLFGLYFFVQGLKQEKYYLLSALFYGMSLYAYAAIWPVMPFLLVTEGVYAYKTKRISWNACSTGSIILLAMLSLPLLLFLLVNYGLIREIRTDWISIPRMVSFRKDDIALAGIFGNIKTFIKLFLHQNDRLSMNVMPRYGMYFKGAVIFWSVGLCVSLVRLTRKQWTKVFLIMLQLVMGIGTGILVEPNVNRINSIHIPNVFFIAIGIYECVAMLYKWHHYLSVVLPCFIVVSAILFAKDYFMEYRTDSAEDLQAGLGEALEYAETISDKGQYIKIANDFLYSKILFYSKIPVDEYLDSVVWLNYPDPYLRVRSFGKYSFGGEMVEKGDICIIDLDDAEAYEKKGFCIEVFQNCAVAYGR